MDKQGDGNRLHFGGSHSSSRVEAVIRRTRRTEGEGNENDEISSSRHVDGVIPQNGHLIKAGAKSVMNGKEGAAKKKRAPSPWHHKGWSVEDAVDVARRHPLPCSCLFSLLFFMGVEYTLSMVPPSSPPLDVGFLLTRPLHRLLAARPALNSVMAALNTVFVGMQAAYILWTLLVEGRPRATISALFMFTCRGILGYSTQLPLPQGFLGSGVDFPVGNVSFFLFFSGHVAGSVIACLDMRRVGRQKMAWLFDALNLLQGLRLLATRGHYTIDLAAGVGAGFLFDMFAGKYEESKKHGADEGQIQGHG